ncbi:hypothetical protein [Paracoccus sp. NSM]|uniref:hypothetical protein n=1 Tax=Paracoccus sp. NSM TaxID=3457784 RepID=UPI0040356F3F
MPERPFSDNSTTAGHPDASSLPSCDLPPFQGPIRPHWQNAARAKGFEIIGRVRDRYHLHLRCGDCAGTHVTKLFVLMSARPLCPHCLAARRRATAEAAGVTFLRQDPEASLYGFYRADCGHVLRRQFEIVDRAARGATGLRCGICLIQREEAEAQRYGWQRLGPDETRPSNYRLYRHGCGHVQSIAQANMLWGQCDCAACGESWSSRPSFIYLFDIRLPADDDAPSRRYLKLGYSAHPVKRYRHQLGLPIGAEVEVLRVVPMPTGHAACGTEKAAHARLVRAHPEAVVPAAELAGRMKLRSEIYRPHLRAVIEAEIDRIARDQGPDRGDAVSADPPG